MCTLNASYLYLYLMLSIFLFLKALMFQPTRTCDCGTVLFKFYYIFHAEKKSTFRIKNVDFVEGFNDFCFSFWCSFCVIAGNISPIDVITHVPILCEESNIPYIYVPSKEVSFDILLWVSLHASWSLYLNCTFLRVVMLTFG